MASTWAWDMISRTVIPVAALALLLTATAEDNPVSVFASDQVGADVLVQRLAATGKVAQTCTETLGSPYPYRMIKYWVDSSKAVWVLAAQGKHGLITAGFVIEGGRIRECRVLHDREQRGRPIRSRGFLSRFKGVGLRGNTKLDRRIHGITGATISSTAMTRMALLALRLDALRLGEHDEVTKDE